MAILNCTMCGGHLEMTADRSIGICECCGSAITFPKVDDDQLAAAFNRGNHFRRMGEFDKALAVYERIVQQDDTEAEAHWCCALCRFGIEYVEDPVSLEWIPTCHRVSFDSFLEDVDYLAALKHSTGAKRIQYQKYAAKIAEVQRGILATSQNAEPFDVFICYKETDEHGQRTRDSLLAQDIYYQLTEQGRRVFFARITLEDIAGSQYEPYIFAALNSARVMVVVGTKPEHLNAVWVKNEWSRFLALMRKDHSRLLLPCYRDMDPYDLPEQLSVLQSYDMSKIGFIQDLIRGISKVLDVEKKPEPPRETVVMQANSNVAALLKRGNMALEDGDWEKADSFYEEVLNQDPECAEAYVGKTLSEEKCRSLDAFIQKRLGLYKEATTQLLTIDVDHSHINELIQQYTIPNYLEKKDILALFFFDLSYPSEVECRKHQLQQELTHWSNHQNLIRALQFAETDCTSTLRETKDRIIFQLKLSIQQAEAAELQKKTTLLCNYNAHLIRADKLCAEQYQRSIAQRETDYQRCVTAMSSANTRESFKELQKTFLSLNNYKNSSNYVQKCSEHLAEYERKAEAERKFKRKKQLKALRRTCFIAVSILLVIVGSLVVSQTLKKKKEEASRGTDYNYAVSMMKRGDYVGAMKAFRKLGDYDDSPRLYKECWEHITGRELIAIGPAHAVAVKTDGTVIAVGNGNTGCCDVTDWDNIIAVSVGNSHTVGLRSNGTVVAVGYNEMGQCDVSSWKNIVSISAGTFHTLGLKSNGTVVVAGQLEEARCDISEWKDIIAISGGLTHTVGLKSDGTVVFAGDYFEGVDDLANWRNIIAISSAHNRVVGLKSDGTVVAVGSNYHGECAVNDWEDIVAISTGGYSTVGLTSHGHVVVAGESWSEVRNWRGIVAISTNAGDIIGLTREGNIIGQYSESFEQETIKIPNN